MGKLRTGEAQQSWVHVYTRFTLCPWNTDGTHGQHSVELSEVQKVPTALGCWETGLEVGEDTQKAFQEGVRIGYISS